MLFHKSALILHTCCFSQAQRGVSQDRSTPTYQSIYVHLLAKNNFDNTDNTHNTRRSCPTQGSNEGVLHNMLAQEMCALFLSQTILAWLYTLVPRISVLIAYFLLHFSIGKRLQVRRIHVDLAGIAYSHFKCRQWVLTAKQWSAGCPTIIIQIKLQHVNIKMKIKV